MAALHEIVDFLAEYLKLDEFEDSSLNGLQIEGAAEVTKIGAAVDAGLAVLEDAAARGVNLLLVHHGLFWGQPRAVTGAHKEFIRLSLEKGISLFAAHLPLDAHPRLGNNALLSRLLELDAITPAGYYRGSYIGLCGINVKRHSRSVIAERLGQLRGAAAPSSYLKLEFGPEIPERVCIMSGSGADQLYQFREDRFDTLISGEPKQFAYHFCRENGLNAYFPGHYASETVGIEALAKLAGEKFALEWEFIDHPTGI